MGTKQQLDIAGQALVLNPYVTEEGWIRLRKRGKLHAHATTCQSHRPLGKDYSFS